MKLSSVTCLRGLGATLFMLLATSSIAWSAPPAIATRDETYRSPYSIRFTFPIAELTADIDSGARGKAQESSTIDYRDWYSNTTRQKLGAWGPRCKWLPPPSEIEGQSAAWQRERVLAVALRYRGYAYQHHHLPDWDPPADWPWLEVKSGRNSKGIDCSNFTGYVYNLALGVRMSTAIEKQASEQTFTVNREPPETRALQVIEKPEYDECVQALRPADLLFIANDEGRVAHVVLWVGDMGESSRGRPLILDSTGTGHKDDRGQVIPDGVQLRPFTKTGWYYRKLQHIHRLVRD